jgi:probable rRNA maturation factor
VLAFAMQEGKKMDSEDLGDIFISVAQVQRQAKRQKISFPEEFARVLIHGVLHLNGYDHATKKEENIMFPLQEKIVKQMVK